MPGCVFHAGGGHFAVDAFLAESSLVPHAIGRRGDIIRGHTRRDSIREEFDFSMIATSADGELAAECEDVLLFLRTHASELARLAQFPGVTDLRLDFAYYRRRTFMQCDYLPPELLFLAGSLRIGVELSLYRAPINPDKNPKSKAPNV